jgi:hypothetical protein
VNTYPDRQFLEAMATAAEEVDQLHQQMYEVARDADTHVAWLERSLRQAHRMFGCSLLVILFLLVLLLCKP